VQGRQRGRDTRPMPPLDGTLVGTDIKVKGAGEERKPLPVFAIIYGFFHNIWSPIALTLRVTAPLCSGRCGLRAAWELLEARLRRHTPVPTPRVENFVQKNVFFSNSFYRVFFWRFLVRGV
jgi:hypothetical protein